MTATIKAGPSGLGGWLILVIISLIVSPIQVLYLLLSSGWPLFFSELWSTLTSPGSEYYHPLWATVLVVEALGNVGILLLSVVTLWHLMRKSRHTPAFAITWFAWGAAFTLIEFLATYQIPALSAPPDVESMGHLIRTLAITAIWIQYFRVSMRVKATFVH
ncbi:MAG: DUF2569 domain-containing protein [Methylotetracoccus sp.]